MSRKPLGRRAYGSIPHLPGSRMGPADHHCHEGQARIVTEKARDRHDRIIVQEKVDGSCVAVAKLDGQILALGRAGYLAETSPFAQHHHFAAWVRANEGRWDGVLQDGQRMVGEWLAQAHGTRYDLTDEPFMVFDVMQEGRRLPFDVTTVLADMADLPRPHILHEGGPLSVEDALALLGEFGHHGALDPVEGAVWRVERKGEVDFLVKWVRPDKVDGCYLPEITGRDPLWNWSPLDGAA